MKIITKTFLLIVFFFPFSLYAQGFKVDSMVLDMEYIASEDIYRNNVAVLGQMSDSNNWLCKVCVYDGENWEYLPYYCFNTQQGVISPQAEPLVCTMDSQIHYDSSGNLWVSGATCMYQYKDGMWNKFYINDSLQNCRQYTYFTVDKNNNLWIETRGHTLTPKRLQFSELIRFNGKKFQIVKRFNSYYTFYLSDGKLLFSDQQRIVTLPDNRILLHLGFMKTLDFFGNVIMKEDGNLLYFNQDNTYRTELIQTATSSYFAPYPDTLDKRVLQIYPETENKIWFALDVSYPQDHIFDGGIVLLENGEWKPFTEANGLKKYNKNYPAYEPITKIIKLNPSQYMAFGKEDMASFGKEESIYTFSNDYLLQEIPKDSILNNSIYIDASLENFYPLDSLYIFLEREDIFPGTITNVLMYNNNELWIFLAFGILRVNTEIITKVKEDDLKSENIIYPNPTFTEINISKEFEYSYYKIYNVYGSIVQEGINQNNSININDLPSSMYFIEFYLNNRFLSAQKFIKM
ncbi:MAG: T9SS type A sorting domain-containing protein [Candidatus Kapabacteria bacterium]|nr:T9SS type A sorting domain-containing protein [Candidatus Kapabacteria bacterium]